ncbi:MAG: NAD-dependent epimerase/dehydratase family protein [Bacteroidia bacterium]|nr:NAD-dependent epimerase/dehydratase family protein [Bacteroidia bacterium]
MNILISGNAGFIGSHLAIKLANAGHQIIAFDNINNYYDIELKFARLAIQGISKNNINSEKIYRGKKGIGFIKLDLLENEKLNDLFENNNFDFVIHLAAQAGVRYSITHPQKYIDSNIQGFHNILECCRKYKVKNLIFASSSSVYGNSKTIPLDETQNCETPISLYAATKKSNELMAYSYYHLFGINTIGLRFFTVYGPWGRPDMALFKFTKSILENKPIKLFNKGNLRRDFTYIDDIIEAIVKIVNKMINNNVSQYEIINIGNSNPIQLLDFVKIIEKATNKTAIIDFEEMQEGDVFETFACTKKLKFYYDFTPKVSIEIGIQEFVKWYKNHFLNYISH